MKRLFLISLVFLVAACSSGGDDSPPQSMMPGGGTPPVTTDPDPVYTAEVRLTEYGIPHVTATDWGGLGYGHAYAYAQENYCILMREVIVSTGQSQRWFGEEGNLAKDFVFALLAEDVQTAFIDQLDDDALALVEGYVAGFNQYLADTGVANLPAEGGGCQNEPWVRAITLQDYGAVLRKLAVRASSDPLASYIFAQLGPSQMTAQAEGASQQHIVQIDPVALGEGIAAMPLPTPEQLGSNAYAVGSDASQNNRGVLFGNPHFPWEGASRFFMVHLTLQSDDASPAEYDAMGAALHGFPIISLGFNKDVAWSHTVSTGSRFVLHELTLNPDNAMQYEFEGAMRDITTRSITLDTQNDSGAIEPQEHTFYYSHFGPIVDLGEVNGLLAGWPVAAGTGTVYALRDINAENTRGLSSWRGMGQADSIATLEVAMSDIGIPWVNTIAADRNGQAFYGDISAVANVTDAQAANCITGPIAPLLTGFGLTTLAGNSEACELSTDADAPAPGVIGYARLPKLNTTNYAANANDSYWLSNPDNLLTGFPAIIGAEEVEQSMRTRMTFIQMEERLAGTDGLGAAGVTAENLRDMLFGSRNPVAELILDDFVADCNTVADWAPYSASPAAVAQACTILGAWDGTNNIDSVGVQIFNEFWRLAGGTDDLWLVAFDPTDPVNTPNTLNIADVTVRDALRQALADGVQTLLDNNIALDAEWGDVQFSERNGVRIPIHGASGRMSFSVITAGLVENEGYSEIVHGNSYMQTIGFDDTDCPDANALLSYSQSSHPESAHYDDQTLLYSQKQWVDMPFCEAEITAAQIGDTLILDSQQ